MDYESASYWDEKKSVWVIEKGEYTVTVGNSAQNVSGAGKFTVKSAFAFKP